MPDAATTPTLPPPGPHCGAAPVVRNERNAAGAPTFRCRAGGRRFVARPKAGPVPDDTRAPVERLRAERLGLWAIARAVGASRSWLPSFVHPARWF